MKPDLYSFGEYAVQAERTMRAAASDANTAEDDLKWLQVAALGLAGEAGEFCDLVKKHVAQGHPLDENKLREELGDVLWYVALASIVLMVPLSKVARENIEKLWKRYPHGFSAEASMRREDKP